VKTVSGNTSHGKSSWPERSQVEKQDPLARGWPDQNRPITKPRNEDRRWKPKIGSEIPHRARGKAGARHEQCCKNLGALAARPNPRAEQEPDSPWRRAPGNKTILRAGNPAGTVHVARTEPKIKSGPKLRSNRRSNPTTETTEENRNLCLARADRRIKNPAVEQRKTGAHR
jgi:hypothetical protein